MMEVKDTPSAIGQIEAQYNWEVASFLQHEWDREDYQPVARSRALRRVFDEGFLQTIEPWETQTPIQIVEFFKERLPGELEQWVKNAISMHIFSSPDRRSRDTSIFFAARRALGMKENGNNK